MTQFGTNDRQDQSDKPTIRCCVCLNQGRRTAMATIVKGYAVCDEHVELVSRPDFDIFHLRGESRAL